MRSRHFLMFSVLCVSVSCVFGYNWSDNPGDGSETNPYQISTPEQLIAIGSKLELMTKHYILMNDISLKGYTFSRSVISMDTDCTRRGFQGDGFAGTFNGNNYTVSHLTIESANNDYIGLFSYVSRLGKIKNLGLVDVTIHGRSYVGGLTGENRGKLSSCFAIGNINGYNSVGGLAGVHGMAYNFSLIENSFATGTINGNDGVGGLVGVNANYGIVNFSHSKTTVNGNDDTGGLIGVNQRYGSVNSCYADCTVVGGGPSGGLVGDNSGRITKRK